MPIYVVIDPKNHPLPVKQVVKDRDICDVAPGVWFVRSDLLTSNEVAKSLNINASRTGIVVSTKNFAGFAANKVVEKISAWESSHAE